MRFLLTPAILLFSAPIWAQNPACGIHDDGTHKPYAAPNYAAAGDPGYTGKQITPPASVGGTQVDPTFGCTITRLTNGPAQGVGAIYHEYSNMSAVNSDDSLVLLGAQTGGWEIINASGTIVVSQAHMVPLNEGRWAVGQPDVLYVISNASPTIISKATINVAAGTMSEVTLHAFSEYSSINFGGGEGDLFDGDHAIIYAKRTSDGSSDLFVYTISTDTKGPVYNFSSSLEFDNAQITGNNQMVVNWGSTTQPFGSCTSGPCHSGTELFGAACTGAGCSPANANYVSHLNDLHSHMTLTRNNAGQDMAVMFDAWPHVCPDGGMLEVVIATDKISCYIDFLPWNSSTHVSSTKNMSGTNWILYSNEDSDQPGSASYPLATNWALPFPGGGNNPGTGGYWGWMSNELAIISTDEASIYRMANSRSRPGGSDYWKQDRACLSRDGGYIIFDSDYGTGQNTLATDYADVYLVNTGIAGTAAVSPQPQPPTGLKAVVQ